MVIKTQGMEEQIASSLLSISAVSLKPRQPFTWASGLRSPIYCDNRLVMGYPEVRATVTKGFMDTLAAQNLSADAVAGTATAGIPHAAWLAHAMEMPMIYVRSKPKAHGRKNQIEGPFVSGQSAIVIEDLISTGTSSMAAVDALKDVGIEVKAVLAIFSYGLDDANRVFEAAGVPYFALSTFDALISVAEKSGHIQESDLDTLRNWQSNPRDWSEQF